MFQCDKTFQDTPWIHGIVYLMALRVYTVPWQRPDSPPYFQLNFINEKTPGSEPHPDPYQMAFSLARIPTLNR